MKVVVKLERETTTMKVFKQAMAEAIAELDAADEAASREWQLERERLEAQYDEMVRGVAK